MVKTQLKIVGCEDHSNGKQTKFQTTNGWMSAFKNEGDNLIDDLKTHMNRLISVEVVEGKLKKANGEPYYNIRKFYGAVAGDNRNGDPNPMDYNNGNVPNGAVEIVEKSINSLPDPKLMSVKKDESIASHANPVRKPVKGSAYEKDPVGLAVEVFNAIMTNTPDGTLNHLEIMKASTDAIQQAQKAFS